jgi:hypothetical protein
MVGVRNGDRAVRARSPRFRQGHFQEEHRLVLQQGSGSPFSATVTIAKLGPKGQPEIRLARITVERVEGAESWVRLGCNVPADCPTGSGFRNSFLRYVKARASALDPSFGHVAYLYNLGATALKEVLGPPWLLPKQTVSESRQFLRGYS